MFEEGNVMEVKKEGNRSFSTSSVQCSGKKPDDMSACLSVPKDLTAGPIWFSFKGRFIIFWVRIPPIYLFLFKTKM